MTSDTPQTARAWQYDKVTGGMENNLHLRDLPVPIPKPGQHLIRVLATSVNPIDFKLVEVPIMGAMMQSKPAIPCIDIAGEVIVPAAGTQFKRGQLVFGIAAGGLAAGAGLAEFTVADTNMITPIPDGVSAVHAAALPSVAITAFQSIMPHVKAGDRVFINGGSGGVGLFAIQIAKLKGCHVTVSCSSRNAELCKGVGADVAIDYTKADVITQLQASSSTFDLLVDTVGDHFMYWNCHKVIKAEAKFVYVGFTPPRDFLFFLKANLLPSFLGGQKRKIVILVADLNVEHMAAVAKWIVDGKMQVIIDQVYQMEQAPDAFRKVKSSRARGKVVIEVQTLERK